jgi:VWFA-related protein
MQRFVSARIGFASTMAFVILAVLVTAGAQTQSSQQPSPTFRSGVEAVRLDVRAEDASGRLVRDLTADDFRIVEGGVPQTLSTFALVDIPVTREPAGLDVSTRVDPDAVSNLERPEGRTFVLVMDDQTPQTPAGSLLRSIAYRALAREFVEKHVTADDLVGLVTMSGRPDMARSLTSNRAGLLEAIARFELEYGGPADDRGALLTLKSVAQYLNVAPGRRKAIVLFSETALGLSASPFLFRLVSQEVDDFRDLMKATAEANVGIYIVDPIGVPFGPGARPPFIDDATGFGLSLETSRLATSRAFDITRQENLKDFARSTGAFAVTGTNDYTAQFDRIVEDTSAYYLLGFTSSNQKADGKFREVRVEVSRPGVHVRTRAGYVAPRDAVKPQQTRSTPGVPPSLFTSIVPVRGTTALDLTAMVKRGVVSVVVDGAWLGTADPDSATELVVIAADVDGRVRASERRSFTPGTQMTTHLRLKPGYYQIRAATVGANDELNGMAIYDLDVANLADGAVALSSIELRRPSGRVATTRRLQSVGEIQQQIEVYANKKVREQTIDVTSRVMRETGEVVFIERVALSAPADARVVTSTIPLRDLPPGRYTLTVEARGSVDPKQVVTRSLAFSVM